ncbi:MAG TPA: gluconokinase [Pyrinomonadaceae bacterium]|jgi:gluconokinase|nr:gluconokinase [Pyrinomonadaceae bacterium]
MVVIMMGVTGSGKTTIGQLLARQLNWKFYDADEFHPPANIEKMHAGIALTDEDRVPWLESLRDLVKRLLEQNTDGVLACSALRENYREYLLIDDRVKLIYLKGDFRLIKDRLRKRRNHFMNPGLLQSQFDTLEEPRAGIPIDIAPSPKVIVRNIRAALNV